MECFPRLSGEIAMMSADPVTVLHGAQSVRHTLSTGQEYTLLVIDDSLQGGAQNLSSILRRTFPQSTVITCASVDDVIRELTRSNPLIPCVITRAKDDLGR